jgi:Tol biopolymer transport system component
MTGRYVAFQSEASNLVSGDTNNFCDTDYDGVYDDNCSDVFVHDRQTGETTRVSVASDGGQGNGGSYSPSISADGYHVAFYSGASNLVGGDTNGWWDIFVHDRQTGEITRVSVASNGTQGDSWSSSPSISADGRYVTFDSIASNLVSGDTNDMYDVFVHDRGASGPYAISGHVSDAAGNPLADVTISAYSGGSATTDGSGTYTFTNLITGTYTLTPHKHIYTFTPTTRTVSVPPDATGQDFTAPELEEVYLPLVLRNH